VGDAFDAEFGRDWGGLLWQYEADDAEVVLIAAGSLGVTLTTAVDRLRAEGVRAGIVGIRAYRPFPAAALAQKLEGRTLAVVFDKAMSYGYEGPICCDVKAAMSGVEQAPPVFGCVCGLGGRDVTPELLVDAVVRAMADRDAGATRRRSDWIGLAE
jgi:pyruvate ferredoxin oxidoreductase alpha subunit